MTPKEFQSALSSAGYDPGPVDGSWGPRTERSTKVWFGEDPPRDLFADPPPPPPVGGGINRPRFFAEVRSKLGPLDQTQVDGFNAILDEWARRGWRNLNQLAYMLATAWWETGRTMQGVREAYWTSEDWRRRNLRYYPYYGRGLVQLTWIYNYRKAGEKLGIDLVRNPDLALDMKNAVRIMFDGMEEGWFTGKSLDDYIDDVDEPDSEDLREYVNGRRIINGTDKASTIGNLALTFERALKE